jgi:hypothetical protein
MACGENTAVQAGGQVFVPVKFGAMMRAKLAPGILKPDDVRRLLFLRENTAIAGGFLAFSNASCAAVVYRPWGD